MKNGNKNSQFRKLIEYKPGDIVLSNRQILRRIKTIALSIAGKYEGKRLLIVGLLNGGFRTTTALCEELHKAGLTDIEIDFIKIENYGHRTTASGNPKLLHDVHEEVRGRHVLVVDDIIETGESLQLALNLLSKRKLATLSSFVLLKKEGKLKVNLKLDYIGFTIPDVWVQGFGMDSKKTARGDPNIRVGHYEYRQTA